MYLGRLNYFNQHLFYLSDNLCILISQVFTTANKSLEFNNLPQNGEENVILDQHSIRQAVPHNLSLENSPNKSLNRGVGYQDEVFDDSIDDELSRINAPKHYPTTYTGDVRQWVARQASQATNITFNEVETHFVTPEPNQEDQAYWYYEVYKKHLATNLLLIYYFLNILVYVLDVGSDLVLAVMYFRRGELLHFILTIVFVGLPSIVICVVNLVFYCRDWRLIGIKTSPFRWMFRIFFTLLQLGPIMR